MKLETGTIEGVDEVGHETHDQPTRERVVRSILVNGASTAAALAERLDLTPAAVRRHLDILLDEGMIVSREPRTVTTRGRGRPAKVFVLAETGGEDAVREFANRRVQFIEDRFETTLADNPKLSPNQALAQIFTEEGYAASVREIPAANGHSGDQLCQQHCPVSHVAHEFPQLCEAETAAISRMLGRHVQRLATIAHGDGVCTTCIPDLKSHPNVDKETVTR